MICFSQHFSDTNFYILIHFSCYGFTKISSLGILKPSVLLFFYPLYPFIPFDANHENKVPSTFQLS